MTKVWTVADATQLKSAFKAAGDGDLIELAPGAVISGHTRLKDRDFADGLTITSADPDDPGLFTTGLEFMGVGGVTLTGFDMERQAYPGSTGGLLTIRGSTAITVQDVSLTGYVPDASDGVDPLDPDTRKGDPIIGYGTGFGLRVINSGDIRLESVAMADFKTVARIENSHDLLLQGLDVTGSRDGITFMATERMTITGSHFHDFKPWWNGSPKINDHADMIQYMGRHQVAGVDDILITGNLFDQGTGWTQTIYGDMSGRQNASVVAANVQVTDNVILNGHRNGIHLRNAVDPVIDNNLILSNVPDSEDFKRFPRIDVSAATGATVEGNVIVGAIVTGDIVERGHVVVDNIDLSIPPDSDAYWRPVHDAWQSGDGVALGDDYSVWAQQLLAGSGTGTDSGTQADADGGADAETDADGSAESGPQAPAPQEPGPSGARLESGTVAVPAGAEDWHGVTFDAPIDEARVVAGPIAGGEGDPAVVRVRNVTETGFEIMIDEWDNLDGRHDAATIGWMAATAGSHALASGQTVVAGRAQLKNEDASRIDTGGFADAPHVFTQVTSFNGAQSVTTRVSDLGAEGFRVRMQEGEGYGGRHAGESVDWIALAAGADGFGAPEILRLDHRGVTVAAPDAGEVLLAAMQGTDGRDPVALHFLAGEGGAGTLRLQEETTGDSETRHVDETVALLMPEAGSFDLMPL